MCRQLSMYSETCPCSLEQQRRSLGGVPVGASALAALLLLCASPAMSAGVTLDEPEYEGDGLWAPVSLASSGEEGVASLQFDFDFDSSRFELVDAYPGEAAQQAGKDVMLSRPAGDSGRLLVVGLNQETIEDGPVARLFLVPREEGADPRESVHLRDVVLSDPAGEPVEVETDVVPEQEAEAENRQSSDADGSPKTASETADPEALQEEDQSLRDTLKNAFSRILGQEEDDAESAGDRARGVAPPVRPVQEEDENGDDAQPIGPQRQDSGPAPGLQDPTPEETGDLHSSESAGTEPLDPTADAFRSTSRREGALTDDYRGGEQSGPASMPEESQREMGSVGGARAADSHSFSNVFRHPIPYGLALGAVVLVAIWRWRNKLGLNNMPAGRRG